MPQYKEKEQVKTFKSKLFVVLKAVTIRHVTPYKYNLVKSLATFE